MSRLPLLVAVLAFSVCVVKYGSRSQPIYGVRTYAQMVNYARHLLAARSYAAEVSNAG